MNLRHSRLLPLALIAPLLLGACGNGQSSTSNAADATAPLHHLLPKDLQGKGSITIASNVEYPPFEFYDTDNTTVLGIDREIADGLEKQLGITINFQNIAFDAIIPGVMSHSSDGTKYATFDGVCGATAGIVKGTTEVPQAEEQSKKCVTAGKGAIKSVIFPGQNQAVLALENNRVDVVLMDSAPGAYAAKQAPGLQMSAPYESQPFGVVFAKGTGQLQKAVQKALENMEKDGSYLAALKKYGLESGAVDAFPINGATQ
jgi:polar amino acid transport system substrate-binding protein